MASHTQRSGAVKWLDVRSVGGDVQQSEGRQPPFSKEADDMRPSLLICLVVHSV